MTHLLAVETSGSVCSVAVSVDSALLSSIEIIKANVHDAMLSRCVRDALEHAGVTINDIDIVALSSGPGSFTGLRIGASFVKGLCFNDSPKFLPVPTLTSLLYASKEVATLGSMKWITALVASHRDLYYVANCSIDDDMFNSTVELLTAEDVRGRILPETLVVGPAAPLFSPAPISGLTRLSARFVSYAAWHMLSADSPFGEAATFIPDYGQEFTPQ